MEVSLKIIDGEVMLVVRDFGRGMPEATQAFHSDGVETGIGLSGMRERVSDLGGTLEIQSGMHGTEVIVRVPARRDSEQTAPNLATSSAA